LKGSGPTNRADPLISTESYPTNSRRWRLGTNGTSSACSKTPNIAGVYHRHEWAVEKRAALDAWAVHVLAAVEGRTGVGNVVTLV
jgi:hypothetical protein